MNMLQELGEDYFIQRFGGSFLRSPEGKPAYIDTSRRCTREMVPVCEVEGSTEKPTLNPILVPADFFADMSVLATPKLGWRAAANGKYMAYYSRNNRSYHRGVAPSNISRWIAPHTGALSEQETISLSYYARDSTLCKLVFDDKTMPLAEGLELLNNGKILGFCLQSELAVMVTGEDDIYELFSGNTCIGTVRSDGTIDMNINFDPSEITA